MRLITRGGYNWTDRYPWIIDSALKNRIRRFVIDGEAVMLGVDGVSDFKSLHSCQYDEEVQPYAFDILALDGEDPRSLPLSLGKTNLARLLGPGGRTASSSRLSSRAKSVPTCFEPPVTWDLRAWCRSGLIARIAPDDRKTG